MSPLYHLSHKGIKLLKIKQSKTLGQNQVRARSHDTSATARMCILHLLALLLLLEAKVVDLKRFQVQCNRLGYVHAGATALASPIISKNGYTTHFWYR